VSFAGSVSAWIGQLKAGEESALGKLHERYWPALVEMARKQLKGAPGRAADEEDVAQEAFWGFYQSLKAGRLPRLGNRHDLLALLTHIVACKAFNQIKHEIGRQKRGGGQVRDEAALECLVGSVTHPSALGSCEGRERTPFEQAVLNDSYREYVDGLPDNLRGFAELYLAGYTNKETAAQMGCSLRSAERKIALVLEKWRALAADSVYRDLPGAGNP
jgi:RNA polymerase sigma factor (sigma-70 family)